MKKMLIKISIILVVVLGTIYYLDASKWFSFDKDHVEKRWNGLYKFTDNNEIDLLILGNSKTYCGINPKTMSVRLGTNAFVLATPNGTLTQSYYNLREALTICKPKMVAIEVTTLNKSTMADKSGSGKSFLYKDFAARRNIYEKIVTTPHWFDIEEYAFAWSTSIRNHNFIFTNTEQLEKNYEKSKLEPVENNKLYLGRYVRFTTGITDSILNKYKTDGAPVNGDSLTISDEQLESLELLINLLKENDIQPVFFTVPMYKEHVKNYGTRYKLLSDLIEKKYGYELFDFQQFYMDDLLTPDCFENTYGNQHMTYNGSLIVTYKLADSIQNSASSIGLINHKGEQLWHNVFYGQENYFYNNTMIKGGKVTFVQSDIKTTNCTIKEIGLVKANKMYSIIAKVPKSCIADNQKGNYQVQMIADVKVDGKAQRTQINLPLNKFQSPGDYYIYSMNVKNIEISKIVQAAFTNISAAAPVQ